MMRLITILLFISINVSGANIYISGSGNDGTGNGSMLTPYRTIQKLNTLSLFPGDLIWFNGGDTFTGTITQTTNNIHYGSYGTGKAILSGFASLNSWTNLGSGMWQSTTVDSGPYMDVFVMNGGFVMMGRSPDAGSYWNIDSHTNFNSGDNVSGYTGQSVTSSSIPTSTNWLGSKIYLRFNAFNADINTVTAQSGTTLQFASKNSQQNFKDYNNSKFFIQNNLACVTTQNEWFYDASAKVVKMNSGANPNTFGIRVGQYDFAYRINNTSGTNTNNIFFSNLVFEGYDSVAIDMVGVDTTYVTNCTMRWIGANAISLHSADDYGNNRCKRLYVQDCDIRHVGNTAINSRFTIKGHTITGNYIDSCGDLEGMGLVNNKSRAGINIEYPDGNNEGPATDSVLILNNSVQHTGYCGIIHQGGMRRVEGNFVNWFGLTISDGGGIYCSRNSADSGNNRNKVWRNIVLNGIGNNVTWFGSNGGMPGVYCDDKSVMLDISYNTIAYVTRHGIFLHNNKNITVTYNNIYGVTDAGIGAECDGLEEMYFTRGIDIEYNDTYVSSSERLLYLYTYNNTATGAYDDIASYGVINNNYYCRSVNTTGAWKTQTGGTGVLYNSIASWQSAYGYDIASNYQTVIVDSIFIFYNATQSQMTSFFAGSTYRTLGGTNYSDQRVFQPMEGDIMKKVTYIPVAQMGGTVFDIQGKKTAVQLISN